MTSYTWVASSPTLFVDWSTAADWSPAIVPNSTSADVSLPLITNNGVPYDFFVTIGTTDSIVVNSLTLTQQDLIVQGGLSIVSGLTMNAGSEIDLSGSLALGTLDNARAVDIQGSGTISSADSIDNQGTIIGSGLMLTAAQLRNDGVLGAGGAFSVHVTGGAGAFANLSGGTLGGGTYEVLPTGTLALDIGGTISADAADIQLGASLSPMPGVAVLQALDPLSGQYDPIAATLRTITPTGTLSLFEQTFDTVGSLAVDGTLDLTRSVVTATGLTIGTRGTIAGAGTLTGPIIDDGGITAGALPASSTVNESGYLLLSGGVSGFGTLLLAPLPSHAFTVFQTPQTTATLELGSAVANDLAFGDFTGTLVLDDPGAVSGTISGFSSGVETIFQPEIGNVNSTVSDTIELTNIAIGAIRGETYAGNAAGGTLTLQEATGSIALLFAGDYTAQDFALAAGPQAFSTSPPSVVITDAAAPCYAEGTMLLSDRGEVAIEHLRLGDRLVTPLAGGTAPVRWLGRRSVECRRHPHPARVWPVLVRAHAFGLGRPDRALHLSPDHAVFIDGVLIPVRLLLNHATVVQVPVARVTYWHVELPHHAVILAHGLPAESYLDLGNRAAFEGGGPALLLHAEFAARRWRRDACAELILGGPVLARVRRKLAVQAALALVSEPAKLPRDRIAQGAAR